MFDTLATRFQLLLRWGAAQFKPAGRDVAGPAPRYFLVPETAVLGLARRSRQRDSFLLLLLLVALVALGFVLGALWAMHYLHHSPGLTCLHAVVPWLVLALAV